MKKIKILLIAFGILCTLTGNAQEEFFKRNTGLSLSGSSDFSANNSGGLSLHLKNGLFFSGSFLLFQGGFNTPTMATIGYLFDLNKRNETKRIKLMHLFLFQIYQRFRVFFNHFNQFPLLWESCILHFKIAIIQLP